MSPAWVWAWASSWRPRLPAARPSAIFCSRSFIAPSSTGHTNFIVAHTNRKKANISAISDAFRFTCVILAAGRSGLLRARSRGSSRSHGTEERVGEHEEQREADAD